MVTLVTGGTGFVGSNIVKALAERGHQVVSLDIAEPDDMVLRYLESQAAQVSWVEGDILDRTALEDVASTHQVTRIVHAAVYTAVREDIEKADSRQVIDINVSGTANLLDLAIRQSVERFVYVSSGGVYEGAHPPDVPLKEDAPVHPRRLYNITKYMSELITQRYGELHGLDTASVRLSSPYGPMERVTGHRAVMSLMYEWTGKAVRGEPIPLVPQGRLDFTYILDIAEGICTVLDAPALPHQLYNIASGARVSLDELVAAFREAIPNVKFVAPAQGEPQITDRREARGLMDASRLRDDLGFGTRFDLVSGIRQYFDWRQAFRFTE